MSFQRARSAEQRAQRRCAILGTAREMLAGMPVAEISLNELARRVGLAKSNVLRYFESREAVLLELQVDAWAEWLDALARDLPAAVDAHAPATDRVEALAAALAGSLAGRPQLCELISTSAAVLERNVSPEVAVRHKRAALAQIGTLGELVRSAVPELPEWTAVRFAAGAVLTAGALWTYSRPSQAMLAAYAADPALAVLRVSFPDDLRELLAVMLAGLLTRS